MFSATNAVPLAFYSLMGLHSGGVGRLYRPRDYSLLRIVARFYRATTRKRRVSWRDCVPPNLPAEKPCRSGMSYGNAEPAESTAHVADCDAAGEYPDLIRRTSAGEPALFRGNRFV